MNCPECGKEMIQPRISYPWELYAWCQCGHSYARKPKTRRDFEEERIAFWEMIEEYEIPPSHREKIYTAFCLGQE